MASLKRIITCASLAASVVVTSAACHRRAASDDETPDTSTYRPESTPASQYERDLKYIRDGHFNNVWVFTRKDGKPFTSEDSQVLRTSAPRVVDWVTTDEQKKVLAGSNFPVEPDQMAVLQKRFNVELLPPQP
jgi:hypothetical protein